MKRTVLLVLMSLCLAFQSHAQENIDSLVSAADSAYIKGDFITAASMYENIIATQGVNATIYMNLGNSWFQQDEIAKAILYYERAYLLDPSDDDIKFNLELARTRTVDKVNPENQLFPVLWFKSLRASLDVRHWTVMTIAVFALAILFVGLLLFSRKYIVRKISLGFALFFFVFSILSFIFASTQMGNISDRDTAIIMVPSVTVKSTPIESGVDLFTIHEGRKVQIIDAGMKEWVEIRLEDGDTGWIPVKALEII
ncbi:MAG: tetratricopeptide repeat protein [Bacteroidaceae bacterium]|nr:tetratricopeptide repeat protein [Bacteroidaceae bacterium]